MKKFLRNVTFPYVSLVCYFVWIGLISGSIVHYSLAPHRYAIIGSVGAVLFIVGGILNEIVVNRRDLFHEGVLPTIRFILASLAFSIGIGMISGGTQHFDDIAQYASWLIPLGFTVSLLAHLVKNGIKLDARGAVILVAKILVIAVPLHLGLWVLADGVVAEQANAPVSAEHDD